MADAYIRPYEPADQGPIEWLYARTPPAGRVYVGPASIPTELERIPDNYEAFWVAVEPTSDGDAVIGMLAVAAIGAPFGVPEPAFIDRSIRAARVHWLLVAPERQRRGIGRRLVDAAIAWARANGYEALLLDTTTEQQAAVAFYEALGFSEVGRSTVRRWELVWFKLAL
jgi:ribosomal protein S18 acetylase RimI-like enzyme